jgi:hypothetical protein
VGIPGQDGVPFLMNEKKGLLERLVADLKLDAPNLEAAVERVSVEAIEMAGAVQSSFAEFNSLMSGALPEIFHRHSAFFIYHIDAVFLSRRALREAICSYYGAAGSLLRSACEAILRGAFWECLAHKRYRDRAPIVGERKRTRKIEGTRRNVLNWMNDVFLAGPQLEPLLETESGAIFDRISTLFESKVPHPAVPKLRTDGRAVERLENVRTDERSYFDATLRAEMASRHKVAEAIALPRVVQRIRTPAA